MLTSRRQNFVRLLALTAAAALVIGMPAIAAAEAPASAASSAGSSSALKKRHARAGAAEEQRQLNMHVQKLTEGLKLSDDQATKVRSILQGRATQAKELRAKFRGEAATPENRAALEKAYRELHADTDTKLAAVLTAEQLTEYRKISAEHMRTMGAKEEKEEPKEGSK